MFEKTLPAKLDKAEKDWLDSQPPAIPSPVIIEEPVDTELQTGESEQLGGPMSIHAPWRRE